MDRIWNKLISFVILCSIVRFFQVAIFCCWWVYYRNLRADAIETRASAQLSNQRPRSNSNYLASRAVNHLAVCVHLRWPPTLVEGGRRCLEAQNRCRWSAGTPPIHMQMRKLPRPAGIVRSPEFQCPRAWLTTRISGKL